MSLVELLSCGVLCEELRTNEQIVTIHPQNFILQFREGLNKKNVCSFHIKRLSLGKTHIKKDFFLSGRTPKWGGVKTPLTTQNFFLSILNHFQATQFSFRSRGGGIQL